MNRKYIKLTALLLTVIVVAIAAVGCAKSESADIDALLSPYLEVIEKVNKDIEPDFYIPDDQKENVYNYYKNYTLEEFEAELGNLYDDAAGELEDTDDYTLSSDFFNLK